MRITKGSALDAEADALVLEAAAAVVNEHYGAAAADLIQCLGAYAAAIRQEAA